jgi:hypothetical protein
MAKSIDPNAPPAILLGNTPRHNPDGPVKGEHTIIGGEPYVCIRNVDGLKPFLMSVVSNTDHWLFVGSNTAITAGRVDPDNALFPYLTADKMLDNPHGCGPLSLFLVERKGGDKALWAPWQQEGRAYALTRNLYKHAFGTSVIFEEINHTLGLRFVWSLAASEQYGLVRRCELENIGGKKVTVRYLDGWHLLLPPGVSQELFSRYSFLAAAYMRHECLSQQTLGIYTLNSRISDRAEPSESLRATVSWSLGHKDPAVLVSNRQIEAFRRGEKVETETEVRGEFGAYLAADEVVLGSGKTHDWLTVADNGLDHRAIVNLRNQLNDPKKLKAALIASLHENVLGLKKRIGAADGLQQTADRAASIHHFANVMFNCMRGGTLNNGFAFPGPDFAAFIHARNSTLHAKHKEWLDQLPVTMTLEELHLQAASRNDPQLARLSREYLPLSFSRRHGDPSRPWNRFSIQIKDSDGNPIYSYQGNWRDIFQNWESLAQSYPACLGSMISVFLNASTADGYNPYRITRNGIDWEVLDPHDPWSHIGYWGDHQIIYLLRLLESYERFEPGKLAAGLNERLYAYAMVPYEIGGFDAIVHDPGHSITFNESLHAELMARAGKIGGDGKLVPDSKGDVELISLAEKLLVPLLVKLSNLIPGGGIWLNTQRPEWNDANNALAGWGLSMVTVSYLRRYLGFMDTLFASSKEANITLSRPVAEFLRQITTALHSAANAVPGDTARFTVATELGKAGEAHRHAVYGHKFGEQTTVPVSVVREFIAAALPVVDATIRANRRDDGMYHAYNLLHIHGKKAAVRFLYAMLEGQVAALSSGMLKAGEVLHLLKSLRDSDLYRADQHSYMLYPDREVAPFLSRNTLPEGWAEKAPLLAALVAAKDRKIIITDEEGSAHFHADLTNTNDLNARLDKLTSDAKWTEAVKRDHKAILEIWEEVFHHSSFTGRSGSMFAFEGLGSIYWHMNAKLLLAVQESQTRACQDGEEEATVAALQAAYYDLRRGLGFTKTPDVYGAFPTDPYSHSPRHRGAQQPGMTGQVKEEILSRFGELGIEVSGGRLRFHPRQLRRSEFFKESHSFAYVNIAGEEITWELPAGTLAFTYCQTPISYRLADKASILIERAGKEPELVEGDTLSLADSSAIFARDNTVFRLVVGLPKEMMRE